MTTNNDNNNFEYKIISSSSKGNAIVYHKHILVDCGVPYSKLKKANVLNDLKLVILTHIHKDHYIESTLVNIAKDYPNIKFVVPIHLLDEFKQTGITNYRIIDIKDKNPFIYGRYTIYPIHLYHNVPNYGYRIFNTKHNHKLIHATDTNKLEGIKATNYDAYFIEYNFSQEDYDDSILEKVSTGAYTYEVNAMRNHLSFEDADEWLASNNINGNGLLVKLHMSSKFKEKEGIIDNE